ncbi:amidohydrolase family protein [Bosea sp. BH3]|uniref:amidohydrolase family protein n=1 Tax=Bosea sp. BH3 TaxID=2871701 RepID=UPI0021CB03E5|nr:amidohydrolase family protein [Bosea sp. BH3]MCU4180890.1 amidohydrolase family protein [Bosea sp. BH3]
MTEIDLLVRAEFLYPMSEGLPIISDGEVAIAGGRILHAGPRQPEGTWQAQRVLRGEGRAVLPGFVNCHSHAASLIFRSQTDDHAAKAALLEVAFRMEKDIAEEEWALLAEAGCADMLCSGITTINDIWYAPDRLAETVERCGLRAQIAHKVFDVRLHELWRGDYTHHAEIGETRLKDGVAFAERWHGTASGRISARIGTHATDTCSAGLLREARGEANRLGVGMHIHAAQSLGETEQIRAEHGCGPLEFLRDVGMLAPDVVLAHLVFAGAGDLDAVQESGAAYAHCPTIYPRRGRYPPLDDILARGIPTGFATDWMMNDPFEGMRNALNAMRLRLGDPNALSCAQALQLHTMGAARVLGLDAEIGSLDTGKKADLIAVDIDRPHLQPYYGGYAALVYYARASDVVTSVIDGQIVLEDARPTRLDRDRAIATLRGRVPGWRARLAALGSRAVFGPGCPCCG